MENFLKMRQKHYNDYREIEKNEKINMQKSATKTDIERHIKMVIIIKINDNVAFCSFFSIYLSEICGSFQKQCQNRMQIFCPPPSTKIVTYRVKKVPRMFFFYFLLLNKSEKFQ